MANKTDKEVLEDISDWESFLKNGFITADRLGALIVEWNDFYSRGRSLVERNKGYYDPLNPLASHFFNLFKLAQKELGGRWLPDKNEKLSAPSRIEDLVELLKKHNKVLMDNVLTLDKVDKALKLEKAKEAQAKEEEKEHADDPASKRMDEGSQLVQTAERKRTTKLDTTQNKVVEAKEEDVKEEESKEEESKEKTKGVNNTLPPNRWIYYLRTQGGMDLTTSRSFLSALQEEKILPNKFDLLIILEKEGEIIEWMKQNNVFVYNTEDKFKDFLSFVVEKTDAPIISLDIQHENSKFNEQINFIEKKASNLPASVQVNLHQKMLAFKVEHHETLKQDFLFEWRKSFLLMIKADLESRTFKTKYGGGEVVAGLNGVTETTPLKEAKTKKVPDTVAAIYELVKDPSSFQKESMDMIFEKLNQLDTVANEKVEGINFFFKRKDTTISYYKEFHSSMNGYRAAMEEFKTEQREQPLIRG